MAGWIYFLKRKSFKRITKLNEMQDDASSSDPIYRRSLQECVSNAWNSKKYCVQFLTNRGNDGAYEVKATRKIPTSSFVNDTGRGSVSVGVKKFV